MSRIERRVIRELRQNGYRVLTRRQWGSRRRSTYQWRRVNRRFVGPADWFFAHISVTNATRDAAADMRVLESIGWSRFRSGVSYNWVLHIPTQTILLGMPHDAAGTHTVNDKNVSGFPNNLNYFGHAISQIGMCGDRFIPWAREAAAAIIAAEKKHRAAKRSQMHPHSKFAAKECPCDSYRDDIPEIENLSLNILDKGDWFDMASKADLREVTDASVAAAIPEIVKEVRAAVLHDLVGGGDNREPLIKKWLQDHNRIQRIEADVTKLLERG